MGNKNASDGTPGKAPEDRGGSQPKYNPNDDRSIVKNPTHPSHDADRKNRQEQAKGS